jgi:hypothetical protein
MSDNPRNDATRRAEALVPPSPDGSDETATANRASLVRALSEDLQAGTDREAADEARLVKVESQTRGLAEAVIAIANPQVTVPAVQAVKDEMSDADATVPSDRLTEL